MIFLRSNPRPSKPDPSSTKERGSGAEIAKIELELEYVLTIWETLAVPLMPEEALMSFVTETDETGAKNNTESLNLAGGLVTLIDPVYNAYLASGTTAQVPVTSSIITGRARATVCPVCSGVGERKLFEAGAGA